MRVMHLINNLNREGAQIMVSSLVTADSNNQVEYVVCTRQPGGALVNGLRKRGIRVIEPQNYYGFLDFRQSLKYLEEVSRTNRIELIHAHMADAAFLGWRVARKSNIPLVISHHGDDILLKCGLLCRSIYYILLNFSARFAAMNIAVSTSVADRVLKLLFIKKQQLTIISNGVELPEKSLIDKKNSDPDLFNRPIKLVNVGRLVPLKGQRQLILAVAQLIYHYPDIKLYIVGGGTLDTELKKLAARHNVDRNIEFTGAVEDVATYLENADIFVSASRSEGMPVSILEAMAWNIPVIASDIAGNRNVVMQNKTGFLFELDNTEELVNTIIKVIQNPEKRKSVASEARKMVESVYSTESSRQRHETLYMSITG